MTYSQILKNLKLPPEYQKKMKSKNSKNHVRRPEMKKKTSENKILLELKNIENDIFENFKNSTMTPKTPKNQSFKKLQKLM